MNQNTLLLIARTLMRYHQIDPFKYLKKISCGFIKVLVPLSSSSILKVPKTITMERKILFIGVSSL
jgi:hypothetical protein